MLRRRLVLGAVVFTALGVAGLLSRGRAVPEGFASIRDEPQWQSPALLQRSWALPVASTYAPLTSQTNPSACGPTSVANLSRSWGAPRSSDDVAAHGTACIAGVCLGGLTLEQLATAARETDPTWKVTVLHPESVEALVAELAHANEPSRRYVINFDRAPLFGTGGGHHSPIGGVLEPEGLIFVLDVNASYQPWLVTPARLFEAMNTVDHASGQKRGLLRFER